MPPSFFLISQTEPSVSTIPSIKMKKTLILLTPSSICLWTCWAIMVIAWGTLGRRRLAQGTCLPPEPFRVLGHHEHFMKKYLDFIPHSYLLCFRQVPRRQTSVYYLRHSQEYGILCVLEYSIDKSISKCSFYCVLIQSPPCQWERGSSGGLTFLTNAQSPLLKHGAHALGYWLNTVLACWGAHNELPHPRGIKQHSGGWEIQDKLSAGLVLLRPLCLACRQLSSPGVLTWPFLHTWESLVSLCAQISPSHRDTSHIGLGPTVMASFSFNYLFKGLTFKNIHILRY